MPIELLITIACGAKPHNSMQYSEKAVNRVPQLVGQSPAAKDRR